MTRRHQHTAAVNNGNEPEKRELTNLSLSAVRRGQGQREKKEERERERLQAGEKRSPFVGERERRTVIDESVAEFAQLLEKGD